MMSFSLKSGRILEIQVHSLLLLLRGRAKQPKLLFKPATLRLVYEEKPWKRVQRRMFKSSATLVISQLVAYCQSRSLYSIGIICF